MPTSRKYPVGCQNSVRVPEKCWACFACADGPDFRWKDSTTWHVVDYPPAHKINQDNGWNIGTLPGNFVVNRELP